MARAGCLPAVVRPGLQWSATPCEMMIEQRCLAVNLDQPRPLHAAQGPLLTEDASGGGLHARRMVVVLPCIRNRGCIRRL